MDFVQEQVKNVRTVGTIPLFVNESLDSPIVTSSVSLE